MLRLDPILVPVFIGALLKFRLPPLILPPGKQLASYSFFAAMRGEICHVSLHLSLLKMSRVRRLISSRTKVQCRAAVSCSCVG